MKTAINGVEPKVYTLQQHMREILKEICVLHREDGYDKFEQISKFVREKNTKLNFQFVKEEHKVPKCFELTEEEEKVMTEYALKRPKEAQLVENYMEDVLQQAKLLEWGGVSFGDEEWFKIRMAMKKILVNNDCEYLRFFGKIYGIKSDYYIIQGILKNYPIKATNPYVESKGNEGINRYTFWVSNSILEAWYELPDITHEQLVTSRQFKYIFTGDLNSKVSSFRPFPGREMHLLKCQIVRILYSSCIVPKEYLKSDEKYTETLEGKVFIPNEEYVPAVNFEEMKSVEEGAWVHEHAYIMPSGKIIPTSEQEQEGAVERMKSIGEDEGYKVKGEAEGEEIDLKYWKVRIAGDPMMHNREGKDPISHAVVLIRNTRWPGTLCAWKAGQFANIYIGFGYKAIGSPYNPTQLAKIDKDPNDTSEQKEPFPEKEPVPEKKEGEGEEGEGEKPEGEGEEAEEQ
ncbi:MAG: hypothetical protein MJ252_15860 [archaeon]|nr:hypothetical protein [archaeon]